MGSPQADRTPFERALTIAESAQFRKAGHGDASGSWVGNGPNRPISPADLTKVLDTDQINTLMSQSGLSRDELLAGLSDQLPRLVDHLTPNGRMPTDEEMSRLV